MPIKTGTRQLRMQPGATIDPKSKQQPRQMRCRCGGLALEADDGKGTKILKCSTCKRSYSSIKM